MDLARDCNKSVECNGTVKHPVSEEPIYFFHWMKNIGLNKEDNCLVVEKSGRIKSKKCDGKRIFICRYKLRPGNSSLNFKYRKYFLDVLVSVFKF